MCIRDSNVIKRVARKKLGFNNLKFAITGAAPINPDIIDYFHILGIPLYEGYGLTETTAASSIGHFDDNHKRGTVGKPLPETEVKIAGDGEILVKGPHVFKGYYKNQEATDEVIKDSWFHTGDVTRQDEDGYYYIVDRTKDMFISGGENVYPVEIENVIFEMDGVLENAVIGVADEKWGEVGRACVVLKEGANLNGEAILSHCNDKLARYKVPKQVRFFDELPHNATGKVLKHQIPRD